MKLGTVKRCLFGHFDHHNSVFPCTLENIFSLNREHFDTTHIQKNNLYGQSLLVFSINLSGQDFVAKNILTRLFFFIFI